VDYEVLISPAALRDLKRIRGPMRRRIAEAVDELAHDPRPHGYVKLTGPDELYRIRVGDYRIVYQIEDDRLIVLVVRVGHRKDIYGKGK
jgi:mRNA interferase RelE/StbE